jgi:hypothetical protein
MAGHPSWAVNSAASSLQCLSCHRSFVGDCGQMLISSNTDVASCGTGVNDSPCAEPASSFTLQPKALTLGYFISG